MEEQKKRISWNSFKLHLFGIIATFLLWIVYLVGRLIRVPLWWLRIESFKDWNCIPEHLAKTNKEKEHAREMSKLRIKDMTITISIILLIPVYIFVPWFWFVVVIGTLSLASLIFVVVTFIRIRAKRLKKEREQINNFS